MSAGPAERSGVIAFRVDASLEIGSGHVMRCLTLADALRERGKECHFLCRAHPGHLMTMIQVRGHKVHCLPDAPLTDGEEDGQGPAHAAWLGTDWHSDAQQSRAMLERLAPEWLVMDHYALDARWERAAVTENCRVLAIDDLADRPHQAEILLDQNLGRNVEDYAGLVPASCEVLVGPHFALLRPEFASLREGSLARRRQHPQLKRLLISLGGVDKGNVTGEVLETLKSCNLPNDCEVTVVMGVTAPWLDDVRTRAAELPWPTSVVVNVSDMAQRMAEADLAIGAAGSTSWERCCLGLPTLMVVLAENQRQVAAELDYLGAARLIECSENITKMLPGMLKKLRSKTLIDMSKRAARLVEGNGSEHLMTMMHQLDRAQ